MTDEYIRKAEAIEAVDFGITLASAINLETGEWSELFKRENDELREAIERIQKIESADVAPVVHGEWLPTNDDNKKRCNKCDTIVLIAMYPTGNANYCPNCGAKMDGERKE